jgi:hypothetical protein
MRGHIISSTFPELELTLTRWWQLLNHDSDNNYCKYFNIAGEVAIATLPELWVVFADLTDGYTWYVNFSQG